MYIKEECYSVVILAKSSALFDAKIFQTPCSYFFARSACKAPAFSLYKVGTYVKHNQPKIIKVILNFPFLTRLTDYSFYLC